MAITNYSDLKAEVATWIDRSDITANIPSIITLGEWRIYRELRVRAMETALSGTISSGVVAVPSDYVEMKYAYISGSPVQFIQRRKPEYIYENFPLRSADGKPVCFSREASNFIFGPYPDSAYTVKGIYYARLSALSDANTSNWFTANAPDLLLFSALSLTEAFLMNDSRIPVWEAEYQRIKSQVQLEDDSEGQSGSPPTVSVSWR